MPSEPNTVQGGPPRETTPHDHDSCRLDGWLDNCCMFCGAAGYWRNGEYIEPELLGDGWEERTHPSGKTLIREEAHERIEEDA